VPLHIKHLFSPRRISQFEQDLDWLLKKYEPVDYKDVDKSIVTGKKAFLLSFDDGLREVYDIVRPLLLQKGIPAVFFLNCGFVNNTGLFFRYKASLLADKLINGELEPRIFDTTDTASAYHVIMNIDYRQRSELDRYAFKAGFDFRSYTRVNKPYLTSDQVKTLINDGFAIGAHGIDHPLFVDLSLNEQIMQVKESVHTITEDFSLNYKLFAFPFTDHGVSNELFEKIKPYTDMTFGTAGLKKVTIPNHFQRIPMEETALPASKYLRYQYVKYLLKGMVGRNVVRYKRRSD
jgi:peptidoglycan/xylan/chitin deacetylase (PgdA/CDA1 family)